MKDSMRITGINCYDEMGKKTVTDVTTRLTPKTDSIYGEKIKIGVMISTCGSLPYVRLGLTSFIKNYWKDNDVTMLVHDDCSPMSWDIRRMCSNYTVHFETTEVKRGHTVGDLTAFYGGLAWANRLGLDVLVKFSRRFIPTYDWVPEFEKLARETQSPTFSNVCMNLNWGFRTECVAMHVPTWVTRLPKIAKETEKSSVFCEGFVHNLARDIEQTEACDKFEDYLSRNPKDKWKDGHVDWPLLGTNRVKKQPGLLWHHSCTPADYAAKAQEYGLLYTEEDFTIPESHLSVDSRVTV